MLGYLLARTGALLSNKYASLSLACGQAGIFDPSPVTALDGHDGLLSSAENPRKTPVDAYREVTLLGLNTNGRLEGTYVTTAPTRAARSIFTAPVGADVNRNGATHAAKRRRIFRDRAITLG